MLLLLRRRRSCFDDGFVVSRFGSVLDDSTWIGFGWGVGDVGFGEVHGFERSLVDGESFGGVKTGVGVDVLLHFRGDEEGWGREEDREKERKGKEIC